jgi:four helix bundle protein
MAFNFEKLKIWQPALALSGAISDMVKDFPKDELFILSSQMKRAADSVVLNIAEGSTGLTNAEFKRFLQIANRSALEIVGCLFLAKRRSYIADENFQNLYTQIETLVRMIQALINSLCD